ncbi:methylamine utilization protein MauJ [Roseateles sp. NT4]|uniref:methylamine utilization protein MauJ n=1 Tax=Roseateles sp. NT4 TaxID=3453715 RepID=UPI003EED028C
MNRVLVEFEVLAHGCLADEIPGSLLRIEIRGAEIQLSDLKVEKGLDEPLLRAIVIMAGEHIDQAESPSTELLREYLTHLSLITSMTFRIHRLRRIVDWTAGLADRDCIDVSNFVVDDRPYKCLTEELVESARNALEANSDIAIKRAIRWFSNGVSSQYPDDQFQYFWQSIELVAQVEKPTTKVPDSCSKCKGDLFCPTCDLVPTHRPYAKQAIQLLFQKLVKGDHTKLYEIGNDFRNAIAHGEDLSAVESRHKVEIGKLVDNIGHVARAALLNHLSHKLVARAGGAVTLPMLEPNMFAHRDLRMQLHLVVKSSNPEEPSLHELPEMKVELGSAHNAEGPYSWREKRR